MIRFAALWGTVVGLLLGGSVPVGATGQPSSPSPPSPGPLRDTVRLAPDGTVEISDTRDGTIAVTTWDRAQVSYEVIPGDTAEAPPGSEGAPSSLASALSIRQTEQKFSIDQDGSSWSIHIPGLLRISPGGADDLTAHYRVTMPETASLKIDDFASHITVTGMRGGLTLDTHSGEASVSFDSFSAPSTVEMLSGRLHIYLPADAGFALQTDLPDADLTVDDAFGASATDDGHRTFNGGGPLLTLDVVTGTAALRPLKAREAVGQR